MQDAMRLAYIWQLIPDNHKIALRVKERNKDCYYSDGFYDSFEACPYYRQYAVVLSVYAISTEIIQVTILENKIGG